MDTTPIQVTVNVTNVDVVDSMIPCFNTAVQSGIVDSLNIVKDRWQQEAQSKLKSSREDYMLGLSFDSLVYPYNDDPYSGSVQLQGKFANMLETGFGSYDMKPGFANSSSVHPTKKGGWYVNVPIRHGTPGSYQMGKPMSSGIYNQARQLPHWGSLSVSGDLGQSWSGYQHKSNIYDSLTRIIKSYGKATQSTYTTWRRMSNNSDADSWKHPGYGGVHIADSLQSFAQQTATNIINSYVDKVFNE